MQIRLLRFTSGLFSSEWSLIQSLIFHYYLPADLHLIIHTIGKMKAISQYSVKAHILHSFYVGHEIAIIWSTPDSQQYLQPKPIYGQIYFFVCDIYLLSFDILILPIHHCPAQHFDTKEKRYLKYAGIFIYNNTNWQLLKTTASFLRFTQSPLAPQEMIV